MHIYVSMTQVDNWPPCPTEEIDAEQVGSDLFRILTTPSYAQGLAKGDIVRVVRYGGEGPKLWVRVVVEASGRGSIRLMVWDRSTEEDVISECRTLGCSAHEAYGMVVVDVPEGSTGQVALNYFIHGKDEGRWDLDVAVWPAGTH